MYSRRTQLYVTKYAPSIKTKTTINLHISHSIIKRMRTFKCHLLYKDDVLYKNKNKFYQQTQASLEAIWPMLVFTTQRCHTAVHARARLFLLSRLIPYVSLSFSPYLHRNNAVLQELCQETSFPLVILS